MNIFNRNVQNNNPNFLSEQELRSVLAFFSARIDSLDLNCLLYLFQLIQDSVFIFTKKNAIVIPEKDHNITTAIFEKCLAIKKKNYELKLRILNLRTSLTHQMHAHRRPSNMEHRYQEVLDGIR